MTMGADPVACAALAAGADVKAFFVRKERKQHGLQRWVEGPQLDPGERCLIVEDVVTTGGSTVQAIERVREEGLEIVGVTERARPAGGRSRGDRGGRGRALPAAHDDRRRLSGAPRPLAGAVASQPSISRREIEYGGDSASSPRPAAAASTSARSNQRTSSSSPSPGRGSPRPSAR